MFIRINAVMADPTATNPDKLHSRTTSAMGSRIEAKAPKPRSAQAIMTIDAITPNAAPSTA